MSCLVILLTVFYLKRCAQSARPWKKAVKEVKEVKTNKTKKLKKTLVQIWHKMAPKLLQNGAKMVSKWPQVDPKMVPRCPKKATKNNKNTKTENVGPKRCAEQTAVGKSGEHGEHG